MNKILPIILVVVLSGCGNNVKPTSLELLEKCADENGYVYLWKNRTFMKSIGFDRYCTGLAESDCKTHLIEFLTTKPLSEKLSFRGYENIFQTCEVDKSNYPETFDARWK